MHARVNPSAVEAAGSAPAGAGNELALLVDEPRPTDQRRHRRTLTVRTIVVLADGTTRLARHGR